MLLDATTKSLEIVLGAAKTLNDCPITANWTDVTTASGNPSGFLGGSSDGATNGVTAVTAVAAPGANVQRRIRMLTVFNADTVSQTVTIRVNDNGTTRILKKATLPVNGALIYADGVWTSQVISVPAGGTTGNVLTKNSASDFDLRWSAPGGGVDVQIFGAGSWTWTKPVGAKSARVIVLGGGGGGGSGGSGNFATSQYDATGGCGGGGGSYLEMTYDATLLGATESITVGAGGVGGAAQTNGNKSGVSGGNGGNTNFGSWLQVYGGGGGAGGFQQQTMGGGGGAGLWGAGAQGTTTVQGAGGTNSGGIGGLGGASGAGTAPGAAGNNWSGAGGAGCGVKQGNVGKAGADSIYGGAGGGSGGGRFDSAIGAGTDQNVYSQGSVGGRSLNCPTQTTAGLNYTNPGLQNGQDGATHGWQGGSGGAGGGCTRDANSGVGNGGKGGLGAGGGGGGALIPVNTSNGTSGAGGNGGDGICVVITTL